jgi:hypothetical protein
MKPIGLLFLLSTLATSAFSYQLECEIELAVKTGGGTAWESFQVHPADRRQLDLKMDTLVEPQKPETTLLFADNGSIPLIFNGFGKFYIDVQGMTYPLSGDRAARTYYGAVVSIHHYQDGKRDEIIDTQGFNGRAFSGTVYYNDQARTIKQAGGYSKSSAEYHNALYSLEYFCQII